MLSRKDLEALHPTTLAVLCQRLSENCSDPSTIRQSRLLKTEWVMLQVPPSSNLQQERENDAKRWDLRKRMVDLLVGRNEVDFYPKR